MNDHDDPDRPPFVAIDGDAAPSKNREPSEEDLPEGANDEAVQLQIAELENRHRALDAEITAVEERMPYDRLTIQRLKKQKLSLKDEISRLHAKILPDIIA